MQILDLNETGEHAPGENRSMFDGTQIVVVKLKGLTALIKGAAIMGLINHDT